MATLGEANVGGRMVPAWLLNMTAEELDNLRTAVCRRNLLDNWYFAGGGSQQGGGQLPVNQRGETSYTPASGSLFSIDRFRVWQDTTMTLEEDGIELTTSGGNTNTYLLEYRLGEDDRKRLAGKTVTLSVLVDEFSGDQARLGFFCNGTTSQIFFQGTGLYSVTGTIPQSGEQIRLYVGRQAGSTQTIKLRAMKLELGTYQTLAYRDEEGNWQLFETPNYGEELAKCQRYFNRLTLNAYLSVSSRADLYELMVQFPEMRIIPTITTIPAAGITVELTSKASTLIRSYATSTYIAKIDLSAEL